MISYRNRIFYLLKPFISRRLQISIRRWLVLKKRSKYTDIWPIDEKSTKLPDEWSGWPDQKKFALVLTHDVDTAKGRDRCVKLVELEMSLGFRSSFNFVPKRYNDIPEIRKYLTSKGFEVGVHGLYHDGKYFLSEEKFKERAFQINHYLNEWQAVGFRSPSMLNKQDWFHYLDIKYDASTFDTDPFEPQPVGTGTIFPFFVQRSTGKKGYVELPYTLPQDHTLFIIMKEKNIDIWKKKLDWIVNNGGMALVNVHPDYMNFDGKKLRYEEYPSRYYEEFLEYIKDKYKGTYWNVLPRDISKYWVNHIVNTRGIEPERF